MNKDDFIKDFENETNIKMTDLHHMIDINIFIKELFSNITNIDEDEKINDKERI
jgi:hypothetical protein